uniref:Bestrophin homolog n=1 Tax=Caenorhabditis tropicalis TaxID=1561998 RepID=A0A1I7USZ4_9PELO
MSNKMENDELSWAMREDLLSALYFPFIWLAACYISYLEKVQIIEESPEVPEIPMTPVTPMETQLNRRRASIETTVSYLSINDVNMNV